jgi:hypothetical protein
MSFEIKNCSAEVLLEKNPLAPCGPYDDVIYKQLPEQQKLLIKACGYPSLPSQKAFGSMLLDVHYLDSYSKKTKGEPFQIQTTFEERFLKSAEIEPSKRDMLIPYSPLPAKAKTPLLDFTQTKVPNNTGAHSLFLYVEPKKRLYEELFFTCQPLGVPPPTPPEVLAMQVDVLEQLDMEQKKLLQAIQYIITSIKDSYKQASLVENKEGTKPIQTLVGEINAYKAKEKDDKKIVDIYTTYVYKVFLVYKNLRKSEIELENDKALREKYEKLIADARPPTPAPTVTAGEGMSLMTSMTTPSGWLEGTNKIVKMLWGDVVNKYKQTRAKILQKMPGYPSEQEMAELLERIKKHELDITNIKFKLEPVKEEMKKIRNALPAWYSQSSLEELIDSKIGLEARIVSKESKDAVEAEKTTFSNNCKALQERETISESQTYKDVVGSIQSINESFRNVIYNTYFSKESSENTVFTQKVILNFMLQLPTPQDDSFDEYKNIWSYKGCSPSGYYAPSKGKPKNTSFLVPTFESYVGLVLRYQALRKISNLLVIR